MTQQTAFSLPFELDLGQPFAVGSNGSNLHLSNHDLCQPYRFPKPTPSEAVIEWRLQGPGVSKGCMISRSVARMVKGGEPRRLSD